MGKPAFDPNKAFEVIKEKKPAFDPNKKFESLDSGDTLGDVKTAIESGVLFGARPFVAGVGGALGAGYETLKRTGSLGEAAEAGKQAFGEARGEAQQEMAAARERSPLASLAGEIGGNIATLPLLPAKGIAGAAKVGGLFGLGQAAGQAESLADVPEEVAKGAALGVATELGVRGLSKGAQALAKKFSGGAEKAALKATGTMLKDIRRIHGKNKAAEIGRQALDEGIVGFGDDFAKVAEKSAAARQNLGETIKDVYQRVDDVASDPKVIAALTPKQSAKLASTKLDAVKFARELDDIITKDLAGKPGASTVLNRVKSELGTLAENGTDINAQQAIELRRSFDELINYDKSIKEAPLLQKQFIKIRNFLKDKVEERIKAFDDVLGTQDVQVLKDANRRFGNVAEINNIAKDRVAREAANNWISLRESIIFGGGVAGGGGAELLKGGDIEDVISGALKGAALAGTFRVGRKYGASTLATAGDIASKLIMSSNNLAQLASNNQIIQQSLVQNIAERIEQNRADAKKAREAKFNSAIERRLKGNK